METCSSFATAESASVEGPGIVSARLNSSAFSSRQKYCERKSSCKQTISAPLAAASRMPLIAFCKFTSGSVEHDICTSPILKRLSRCALGATVFTAIFLDDVPQCSMIRWPAKLHVNPAVHVKHVPGDKSRFIAHQELHGMRDIVGISHPAQRCI